MADALPAWLEQARLFLQRSWPPINNGQPFLFANDDGFALVRTDCVIVSLFLVSDEGRASAPHLRVVGRYLPISWRMINHLVGLLSQRIGYATPLERFYPNGEEQPPPLPVPDIYMATVPILLFPGEGVIL